MNIHLHYSSFGKSKFFGHLLHHQVSIRLFKQHKGQIIKARLMKLSLFSLGLCDMVLMNDDASYSFYFNAQRALLNLYENINNEMKKVISFKDHINVIIDSSKEISMAHPFSLLSRSDIARDNV